MTLGKIARRLGFAPGVDKNAWALALLGPLLQRYGYVPWSRSAMLPAAVARLVNEVYINRRRCVVEFGSGISTLLLAPAVAEQGGSVVSFEEDEGWAAFVNERLAGVGFGSVAKVVPAPLKDSANALDHAKWYDESVVSGSVDGTIDLLVVDGPKAFIEPLKLARYPAVPFLLDRLAENCAVYLDDIKRKGEKDIFARWEQALGCKGEVDQAGGCGVIARGPRFYAGL